MTRRNMLPAALLTAAGLAFIAAFTLVPSSEGAASWPRFCALCGATGGQNVLLNVLLFLPFGLGLALLRVRTGRALVLVAALAVTIEALQYVVVVGRLTSVADAASNTLGGWLGIWAARTAWWWLAPTAARARWLLAAWSVVWLVTLAGTAELVRLAPAPREIIARPAYAPAGRERFRGEVLAFTIGTARAAVGSATFARPHAARASARAEPGRADVAAGVPAAPNPVPAGAPAGPWRAGRASLAAAVTALPTQPRTASVVTLLDRRDRLVGELARDGGDLVVRFRLRASAVRLGTPGLRLPGAFRLSPSGKPLRLAGGVAGGRLWSVAEGRQGARQASYPLTAALGWSLLLPFGYALDGTAPWLTALWVAGLVAPLGYWGAWAAHVAAARRGAAGRARRVVPVLLAALLVLGLAGAAAVGGGPLPGWSAWLAGALGVALGSLLAQAIARCAPRVFPGRRTDARAARA